MHRWYEPDDLYWDSEFDDVEHGMDCVQSDINVRKVVVMGFYTGGAANQPELDDDEEYWEYDERTWWEWLLELIDWLRGIE